MRLIKPRDAVASVSAMCVDNTQNGYPTANFGAVNSSFACCSRYRTSRGIFMPRSIVDRYTAVIIRDSVTARMTGESFATRTRTETEIESREKKREGQTNSERNCNRLLQISLITKPEMISGRPRAPNEFIIQIASILLFLRLSIFPRRGRRESMLPPATMTD